MITLVIGKKQFEEMYVWFNNNGDNPYDWLDEFIFDKYELFINIEGNRSWIKVDKKDQIISVSCEHEGIRKFIFRFSVWRTEDDKMKVCEKVCEGPLFESLANDLSKTADQTADDLKKFATAHLSMVFIAESYIMTKQRNRKVKYEEIEPNEVIHDSNAKKRKHIKKRRDEPVMIDFDDIISGRVMHGRKHIIRCGKWPVRGHYRHYKNGKVVFIKQFEKGKNRNTGKKADGTYIV